MIQRCRRRWPRFRFLRTDAEKFDAPDRYDLIASNCAWQWFADRRRAAANLGRLLAADGLLALAAPVRGSFPELDRASREATGRVPSSLQLSEPAEYLDSFPAAGWEPLSARVELIRADYATPWDVLRSFKGIGALYRPADYRPYTIKQLADLCRSYQRQHNPDQTVPLTYRVLFLVLRKKGGG
jgi:SAM-dependent methyltransferase